MRSAEDFARLAETAFNNRDEAGLLTLWTDDFDFVGPGNAFKGAQAMIAQERNLWAAFPDVRGTIRLVCAGDGVSVQESVLAGTHLGPYRLGARVLEASGRKIEVRASVHLTFRGDRACAERVYLDQLGLLQQMGLLPVAA